MIKGRIAVVEKRLAGLGGPTKKNFRLVYQFDGDPEPQAGPEEDMLVVRVVNTRREKSEVKSEDEHVFRFDFGDSGQPRRVNDKKDDSAERSHQPKRS
jgi:hypothetical protein